MQPNTSQKRQPQRNNSRKFFQQLQPTFAVAVPTTATKLYFVDENDPAKDIIVRKKAREWVNKNRDTKKQDRQKYGRSAIKNVVPMTAGSISLHGIGRSQFDPFNVFPNIGRKYDHIVDFFRNVSPEQVPCCDDKYAHNPSKSLVAFSCENTVVGNMAQSQVALIVWLYATVIIRDSIQGPVDTEEGLWFYSQALRAIQETLNKEAETGQYSDHLLNSLACIAAAASLFGMLDTAMLHRDAMVRILAIRGDGDMLKGLRSVVPWTSKQLQWCEMTVAAQLADAPKMPYYHAMTSKPLPDSEVCEVERLTANTLSNVPHLSEPIRYIIRMLHHIGVAYAQEPVGAKVDSYIYQPLYNAQWALLHIQKTHKMTGVLSDVEYLLVQAIQLYFHTALRKLPPQTRPSNLFVSRLMKALLPLLMEKFDEETELDSVTVRGYASNDTLDANHVLEILHHPRTTNNVIVWSLALGTIITAPLNSPEYAWMSGHFRLHLQAMGLDQDQDGYHALLGMFPSTDSFAWLDLRTLFGTL